jgi:hypothetical protein
MSLIPQFTGLLYLSTLPKYVNNFSPHIWVKSLYELHVTFIADFSLFEIDVIKCITWNGGPCDNEQLNPYSANVENMVNS